MHVSFRAYVELDAPCLLRLLPRARVGRAGTWEAIEPHLELYQRGVQVGSFGGRSIGMHLREESLHVVGRG